MSKGSFLSGPEPTEVEHLTEAQKNDLRRPGSMTVSAEIYQNAEDDQTPAIEQKISKNGTAILTTSSSKKPKLNASANFAQEIKERQKKEQKEREKHQKQLEEANRLKAEKRKKEIEEEINTPQTLDPEELEKNLAEQNYQHNQEQLYPDAKPTTSDLEEAIWQKRKDNGDQITKRAKIDSIYDTRLNQIIRLSFLAEAFAVVFTTMAIFTKINDFSTILATFLSVVSLSLGIVCLVYGAKNTRHHTIPGDQTSEFRMATIIPGLYIRFLLIILTSMLPFVGKIVGVFVGTAIGASIHYTFLNNYGIYVSKKDTLINTAISIVPLIIYVYNDNAYANFDFVFIVAYIFEFIVSDGFAMFLAYRTNK